MPESLEKPSDLSADLGGRSVCQDIQLIHAADHRDSSAVHIDYLTRVSDIPAHPRRREGFRYIGLVLHNQIENVHHAAAGVVGADMPGIVNMQVAAIIGAACEVKKSGMDVHPEIMIPLVSTVSELTYIKAQLEDVAKKTMAEEGIEVDYQFGTMIEIPRAALTADEIAREAAFFSFGTNDLTQMGYGISRDDAAKFLPLYIEKGIFKADPTETIDTKGIGRMMRICVEDAKAVNPSIKLGICGEHGGEPDSVKFCHQLGLNYVSCSPRRIPVARLAAAQAVIEEKGEGVQRDK